MNSGKEARILATRGVMMPRDAHGQGAIDGDVLLKQIDIAGALTARRACSNKIIKRLVTRAMDNIEYKQPVRVNDVLTCYGYVLRIGRTSITVQVEVEVDRLGETIPVTVAQLTFVALDANGRPTPVLEAATALPGSGGAPSTAGGTATTGGGTTGSGTSKPGPASDTEAIEAATPVGKPAGKEDDKSGKGKGKDKGKSRNRKSVRRQAKPVKGAKRMIGVRATMYPADTNGMGNIFGGHLLGLMNQAGGYVARRVCTNHVIERCASRAMGKVEFKQPVHVNDDLTVYGVVTKIGTTSITVHVEAEVERKGVIIPVTSADLVYVAVDEKGVKTPVLCGVTKKSPRKRAASANAAKRRSTGGDGCCGGGKHTCGVA